MNLETEMARFNSVDLQGMKGLTDAGKGAVGGTNRILAAMGATDEDTLRYLRIGTSALQAISGSLGVMRGLQALYNAKIDAEAAEGAALTAIKAALGPWGWAQIAIAAGASVGASAFMYAMVNTIEVGDFDLSTTAGINSMLGSLEGLT